MQPHLFEGVQSQLQAPQYYSYPALTRYFDHIQNRPSVREAAAALGSAFAVVPFDLEHAPSIERKADPPKEKKKAAKPAADQVAESSSTPEKKGKKAAAAGGEEVAQGKKEGKKEAKKEAVPAEEGQAKAQKKEK